MRSFMEFLKCTDMPKNHEWLWLHESSYELTWICESRESETEHNIYPFQIYFPYTIITCMGTFFVCFSHDPVSSRQPA